MHWVKKVTVTFLMGTTSSMTMQSLGKIVQRCRCENMVFVCFFYREDAAKLQTAGIKFTHRPKSGLFAPRRRLIAQIHVKLGRADGHVGPLGCAKFHLNRCREVGMRPPK